MSAANFQRSDSTSDDVDLAAAAEDSLLELVVAEIGAGRTGRFGNGPDHGHSQPGIWDDDNGALAGKRCALCAVWFAGQALFDRRQAASGKSTGQSHG